MTGGICGHDRQGLPVRVEPIGYLDMKGIMCSCRKTDLEKSKIVLCELLAKDCKEQSLKARDHDNSILTY